MRRQDSPTKPSPTRAKATPPWWNSPNSANQRPRQGVASDSSCLRAPLLLASSPRTVPLSFLFWGGSSRAEIVSRNPNSEPAYRSAPPRTCRPPGSRWYGQEVIKGGRFPSSITLTGPELVRPGGYQGDDRERVPLSRSTCPAGRDGTARKVPREQPRGAPSLSSTTPAWAEVLQWRGPRLRGRHRPAAPPSPGPRITARRVPRPRAAIAQLHHLHLG